MTRSQFPPIFPGDDPIDPYDATGIPVSLSWKPSWRRWLRRDVTGHQWFFMGTLLSKNGNDSGIIVGCIMLLSMEKKLPNMGWIEMLLSDTIEHDFEFWNMKKQWDSNNMKQYETCVFWLLSKIVDLKITRLWSFDQDAEFTITIGTLPFDGTTIMFNNHYPSLP